MPSFGRASRARLVTCCSGLINICETLIEDYDFTVIWGRRGELAQNEAYRLGNSTKKWPDSLHNTPDGVPSRAIDIAPWHVERPHIRWEAEREFVFLAGRMVQVARAIGENLRWGGNWDQDQDLYDLNKPFDLGHFELL